jgi:creatinine amidohydrolase
MLRITRLTIRRGAAVFLLLSATAAAGQEPARELPPSVTLPPELARVLRDYEAAWTRKDAGALAALFTDDGFVMANAGVPVSGRDAIRTHYTGSGGPLFLRPYAYSSDGDVGYILGGFTGRAGAPDAGKFTLALRKGRDGRWLIAADMDSPNRPPQPSPAGGAVSSPLWREERVKNFLPHMTWPEVRDLLTRTDIVLIPVPSLEQHGFHAPIGTDYYSGVERAKLVAQKVDVLVTPILYPGQSPYHMEFPGSIALSADTIQRVYFEAAQSLIRHGFRRFLFMNSHAGNQYITRFVVDRINQETAAVALELGDAVDTMEPGARRRTQETDGPRQLDRHGGVGETSTGLYLYPSLLRMDKAERATLTHPPHLAAILPQVAAGDRAASLIFLAEGLKPKETGKGTSAQEMSTTGVWSQRDPKEATAEQGRRSTEAFVDAAVRFIEHWKQIRPVQRPQ